MEKNKKKILAGLRPAPPQRDPKNLCLQGKLMALTLHLAFVCLFFQHVTASQVPLLPGTSAARFEELAGKKYPTGTKFPRAERLKLDLNHLWKKQARGFRSTRGGHKAVGGWRRPGGGWWWRSGGGLRFSRFPAFPVLRLSKSSPNRGYACSCSCWGKPCSNF